MSAAPRLAVIIANYNYEAFVAKAIDSVLRQNCADIELVVVDDGSTDGSWGIIQSYGTRLKALRVANGGQAKACLFGVAQTQAPFVLLLDADDELVPGSLDIILGQLDPAVAKLQYALTPIDATGRVLGDPRPALTSFRGSKSLAEAIGRDGEYVSPPTSGNVFRRDLFARIAPIDYESAIDGVILLLAPFVGDVVSLAQPLGLYRLHGQNFSAIDKPTPARFAREADRFAARLTHLARILTPAERAGFAPADPRTTLFFTERRFYEAVASGRRPSVAVLRRFIKANFVSRLGAAGKMSRFALAGTLWVLPKRKRLALLGYRFHQGRRTPQDLLKTLLRA
ncbi:glycosyltransferase [Beijerinckia sp. L45]|uniref:glycosyltransferase family 2 protein n=1 Tax=Beijerinckia sp. L45 TaxID=1641855 RepID=UPI00131EC46F|nr:glycosyltransferase [Beijerinckia sp. L45]